MDERRLTRHLSGVRAAALAGGQLPSLPRPMIGDSWNRMRSRGIDPDRGVHSGLLALDEVERRRQTSPLAAVLPTLREGLVTVADEALHIMVVTDADGRVLWRDGSVAVRRKADGIGLEEGASWAEDVVGTNAVGTALVEGRPMQVHSAEHFVRVHHAWTCAAAPLRDPRDGRLLGVVDVSGPAATVHPSTLALVTAVARLAECEMQHRHLAAIERLRSVSAPILCRLGGRALAVDRHGWTAAVTGMSPPDRVALPKSFRAGHGWLPALGVCAVEPLPDGWLIRVSGPGPDARELPASSSRVVLDLRRPRQWALDVSGAAGSWSQQLSPRHAELLYVLSQQPEGRTAAQLAEDLFGDAGRTVTVRAEMSRVRRTLAGVLDHRPYRFAEGVEVVLQRPDIPEELLPHSSAPGVLRLR